MATTVPQIASSNKNRMLRSEQNETQFGTTYTATNWYTLYGIYLVNYNISLFLVQRLIKYNNFPFKDFMKSHIEITIFISTISFTDQYVSNSKVASKV